jgi:hypothetical protein
LRKRLPFVPSAEVLAAEQLQLIIGRGGVLSCRAIAAEELAAVLRLLGPPSKRQRHGSERGKLSLVMALNLGVHGGVELPLHMQAA